jgi:hypothetical protein
MKVEMVRAEPIIPPVKEVVIRFDHNAGYGRQGLKDFKLLLERYTRYVRANNNQSFEEFSYKLAVDLLVMIDVDKKP